MIFDCSIFELLSILLLIKLVIQYEVTNYPFQRIILLLEKNLLIDMAIKRS